MSGRRQARLAVGSAFGPYYQTLVKHRYTREPIIQQNDRDRRRVVHYVVVRGSLDDSTSQSKAAAPESHTTPAMLRARCRTSWRRSGPLSRGPRRARDGPLEVVCWAAARPNGVGIRPATSTACRPPLPSALLPMNFATSILASLHGSMCTLPHGRRRKRIAVQKILEFCVVVCAQKGGGLDADLQFVSSSYQHFHSLMPASVDPYTSREGCVLIALRRGLAQTLTQVGSLVVRRGRLVALRMQRGNGVSYFFKVHMDLAANGGGVCTASHPEHARIEFSAARSCYDG